MNNIRINPIEKEDILSVVKIPEIEWNKFKGKTIAISGANGLIGKFIIYTLLEANKIYHLDCKVIAFVRNVEKAVQLFGEIESQNLQIIKQDVMKPVPDEICADYLVHGASITTSKLMVERPVETILTTVEGTRNMVEFALRCNMRSVVYLSSMEVYGIVNDDFGEVTETDLGYIDLLNVRSSYSESKRMAECLCASYASEYGVNIKIARLAQTFGAGISKEENRVFAQFARSVLNGDDIILQTKGDKANCYCYTSDAIAAILLLLTKGEKGQTYNVANEETFCSIKEMAEMFLQFDASQKCKLQIKIPEQTTNLGYAPKSILKLNSEKMRKLGWKPQNNMQSMVSRLLASLRL